jgi:hypothetical protein
MNGLEFEVGAWYSVTDAPKSLALEIVLEQGLLQLPEKFQCTSIDEDGDCHSTTPGVLWRGEPLNDYGEPVMCGTLVDLRDGTFIKVEE